MSYTASLEFHDAGKCHHAQDHDRSLPDGTGFDVDNGRGEFVTVDDFEQAAQFAREHDGHVSRAGQRVADDGTLGCNDCGSALYYCTTTAWFHHVDPDRACNLAGYEVHDYYHARVVVS
jgi:hypothetical protein